MKPHYNVVIATPAPDFEREYVASLVDTIEHLHAKKITYKFVNQYSSIITFAREGTISDNPKMEITERVPFGDKFTYDKIVSIDSDMSWTVEDFMKLYESDKDIVSGLCANAEGGAVFTPLDINLSAQDFINETEVFEIFAAGFAFMAIKQGVFESIERPWSELVYVRAHSAVTGEKILIPFGEDYSWFQKAKQAGYKIYMDPTARIGHIKKREIKL
jgi:hypothetical protein